MCVQHEMDHLLGKVFVDYLSRSAAPRDQDRMLKVDVQADDARA